VKLLDEIHAAFADYHVAMPLVIAEDDTVAVRMVLTGTHTAPFKGIPAHGKHVRWEILAIMKFKDGLIYEQESFRDWLELMSQLQWPRR
jgi:predicted ester cyclase